MPKTSNNLSTSADLLGGRQPAGAQHIHRGPQIKGKEVELDGPRRLRRHDESITGQAQTCNPTRPETRRRTSTGREMKDEGLPWQQRDRRRMEGFHPPPLLLREHKGLNKLIQPTPLLQQVPSSSRCGTQVVSLTVS